MITEERFVETSYGTIYAKCIGTKTGMPDLVLLHDAIGSVSIWGSFPQKLQEASGRRVVLFDRLGYGKSGVDEKERGVDYMLHEANHRLPELLSLLEIKKPILVGHSDGGTIGLLYAAKFQTTAVISMAGHIYVEERTRQGISDFFEQPNFPLIAQKLKKHHFDKTNMVLSRWKDVWLSEPYACWNIKNALGSIKCPGLILQGRQDEYATDQHAIDIKNGIKNEAELHFIEDCGHVPYKQRVDKTLLLISDFLTKI